MRIYLICILRQLGKPRIKEEKHISWHVSSTVRERSVSRCASQAILRAVLYAENAARSRRRRRRRRCWIWWRKRIKAAQRLAGSLAQIVRHPPADRACGAIFVLWLRHMFVDRHCQRRFVESSSSQPLNYSQLHSVATFLKNKLFEFYDRIKPLLIWILET